jgi:RNA polymerase sigma factor (sigma-70 family)
MQSQLQTQTGTQQISESHVSESHVSESHVSESHVFESHVHLVHGICSRILKRPSDIDDAVQETFIKFNSHVDEIHSNVSSWLHSCARTTALDIARRIRSANQRTCDVSEVVQAIAESKSQSTEDLVSVCVTELANADRAVITSYFYGDKTQQCIADELDISISTVNTRLTNALARLRLKLLHRGVAPA